MSDTLPDEHPNHPTKHSDCGPSQLQELNDVKECLTILHDKAAKYKILFDVIQETVFSSNTLDSNLKTKVRNICLGHSCAQTVDLDGDGVFQESRVLLGLTDITSSRLTYNESTQLKKAVEIGLQNKYNNICDQFYKITGVDINTVPATKSDLGQFGFSTEDCVLIELKSKLENEQKKYFENLLEEQAVLEDLTKLRLDKVPELCNVKVLECQVKSKLSELQSKIVEEKTRIHMFMESTNSLPAYTELMKDIQEQKLECQREIQYLQKQKEKYQQVSCKQYDDILKSFLQYKSSLEKKKMIYETLHAKDKL